MRHHYKISDFTSIRAAIYEAIGLGPFEMPVHLVNPQFQRGFQSFFKPVVKGSHFLNQIIERAAKF
jgi:hypothetical protein